MNFRPVFISGCDRSGTTMLGDMLGCTEQTITTPESQFFHEMLLHFQLEAFSSPEEVAHWLVDNFRFAAWGLQASEKELAEVINIDKPRETIEGIIRLYLMRVQPGKTQAGVWIDHTPDNFKYYALLKSVFPDARFIHIIRDGRAVCDSFRHLDWGPNNAYSASRHWAERLQQALIVEFVESDNCQRVFFEKLVKDPEKNLEELCIFADIPYTDTMVNGGGLVIPGFTETQHKLVGKRPQASKADAWRANLSQQELRDFESYPFSRLLLEKLGYDLTFDQMPTLSRTRILTRYCHEFVCYLRNRNRHRNMENNVVSSYQKSPK
ncbi:sulfotransferase family protein [Desulfosediminicola flagellatus]|uniref:sulfotransferase family protein n=1 Tax=Desulfosediminicola flagellatus TaxID=2569541 RepID=UPI0010AD4429|nr:sulfotransferase [Desulfosediminicola flagellatus]